MLAELVLGEEAPAPGDAAVLEAGIEAGEDVEDVLGTAVEEVAEGAGAEAGGCPVGSGVDEADGVCGAEGVVAGEDDELGDAGAEEGVGGGTGVVGTGAGVVGADVPADVGVAGGAADELGDVAVEEGVGGGAAGADAGGDVGAGGGLVGVDPPDAGVCSITTRTDPGRSGGITTSTPRRSPGEVGTDPSPRDSGDREGSADGEGSGRPVGAGLGSGGGAPVGPLVGCEDAEEPPGAGGSVGAVVGEAVGTGRVVAGSCPPPSPGARVRGEACPVCGAPSGAVHTGSPGSVACEEPPPPSYPEDAEGSGRAVGSGGEGRAACVVSSEGGAVQVLVARLEDCPAPGSGGAVGAALVRGGRVCSAWEGGVGATQVCPGAGSGSSGSGVAGRGGGEVSTGTGSWPLRGWSSHRYLVTSWPASVTTIRSPTCTEDRRGSEGSTRTVCAPSRPGRLPRSRSGAACAWSAKPRTTTPPRKAIPAN